MTSSPVACHSALGIKGFYLILACMPPLFCTFEIPECDYGGDVFVYRLALHASSIFLLLAS